MDPFVNTTPTGNEILPMIEETPGRVDSGVKEYMTNSGIDEFSISNLIFEECMVRSVGPMNNRNDKDEDISPRLKFKKIESTQSYDDSPFYDEEMLIVYYATDLALEDKNSDALRAICEYLQKQDISDIAMANLSKLYAVLLMISNEYQNAVIAIKYFKKAINHFQN